MATYVSYSPDSTISRALFNFDALGSGNFILTGSIRVTVSDAFTLSDYNQFSFYRDLYTSGASELSWTSQMQSNIQEILQVFSEFANLSFDWDGHFDNSPGSDSTPNARDVGLAGLSDINISRIYRSDVSFAGVSGVNDDEALGYAGGAGDIFLNDYWFSDNSLALDTEARQTLMHEIGHSLGLAHPHFSGGALTADFAATRTVGFDQLGFRIDSADDMDKEYFTIMSYDDQPSRAHTPMILDVVALQQAYGEGSGTTTASSDVIVAGSSGYRTYFDAGGVDTINLSLYTEGVNLQMGVHIAGAAHLVGVAMGTGDAHRAYTLGNDPLSLRWFYGEYENADASAFSDRITGNELANSIEGRAGSDWIRGLAGDDTLSGGDGLDSMSAGTGHDLIYGDGGNDQLDGEDGNDTIFGGEGADLVESRLGADTVDGGIGEDTLSGGGNMDVVSGGPGNDVIYGDGGSDVLLGEDGNDRIFGGDANDQLHGGVGDDVLDGQSNSDQVYAGDGADRVEGRLGADVLRGEGGNDIISGGDDADLLVAGEGDDVLFGDEGADTLDGGAGFDRLSGGSGPDRFAFSSVDGNVDFVTDFTKGPDGDVIDLTDILIGYDGDAVKFIRLLDSGAGGTTLAIDADGGGGFSALVSLAGVPHAGTLLAEMLDGGNIVA